MVSYEILKKPGTHVRKQTSDVQHHLARRGDMELSDDMIEQLIEASGFNNDGQLHAVMIIKCIAINPATPVAVLDALSNHSHIDVIERIAGNRSTSPKILAELAMHPNPEIRAEVAENPKTPEKVLWILAHDESIDVRYRLAENCNVPQKVLQFLSDDDNAYVATRATYSLSRVNRKGVVGRITEWFDDHGRKASNA
jgi:hypothetical protein